MYSADAVAAGKQTKHAVASSKLFPANPLNSFIPKPPHGCKELASMIEDSRLFNIVNVFFFIFIVLKDHPCNSTGELERAKL